MSVTVLSRLLGRGGKETLASPERVPAPEGAGCPGHGFPGSRSGGPHRRRPLHTESASGRGSPGGESGVIQTPHPEAAQTPSPRANSTASPTDPTDLPPEGGRPNPLQPLEPILIPKVRIWFADFPHPHYSARQRLFTLETGCGYVYGQGESTFLSLVPTAHHLVFKDRRRHTGSDKKLSDSADPARPISSQTVSGR